MHRAKATGFAAGAGVAAPELAEGPALATAGPGGLAEQAAATAVTAKAKVIEARLFIERAVPYWVRKADPGQ
jgi:hypothetical protein